ncbi:MAG: VWA domain-containing protein, partial [Lachnospiraceae bacterium]|nr:VWA domain-containing protein [Lachnospiraceae bacterium]
MDIIYCMGAFIAASDVETDLMINSLYDTFAEIIAAGTTVNFGVVPFSTDNKAVMELTTFATMEDLATLPAKLAEAIEQAAIAYGGENMENALQTAKRMFSESPLAEHPERQHLVLVATGHTYNFNSGENNELFSTVPVAINDSKSQKKLFYGFKAWMQARNANPNTYPIPKAFTEYMDSRDWDAYWEQIELWAAADVEAEKSGERNLVYVIRDTTDSSFTYNNWYTTDYLNQDT